MSAESRFHIYGDGEPTVLALPERIEDYLDLKADLDKLAASDPLAWKRAMRLWSAGDLYFFGMFVLTMGSIYDPYWERPRFWCAEQLEIARWVQFHSKGSVFVASRFLGKSSWSTFADNIRMKLIDPNRAACIFSATREVAAKHNGRIGQELLENRPLQTIWDDRFHRRKEDYAKFSEFGITIKRETSRLEATFEAQAFISKLPTGAHYDERRYDDIEDESSVKSKDLMDKLEAAFISSQDLASPVRWAMIVGTYYHPAGLVRRAHLEKGWTLKLIPGEDLASKPADGVPPGPLGGAPFFFHPQELADVLRDKGGKNDPKAVKSYTEQICCNPTIGQPNRLDRERLLFYDEDPLELAETGNLYICIDCSTGGDPTWAWVWRLGVDRRQYWVGGFRKRLKPADRRREIALLALQFNGLGTLVELRIEEFGQAEYIEPQVAENRRYGLTVPIRKCCDNTTSKVDRNFERWEPQLANGRVVFPKRLESFDEKGGPIDLVEYFLQFELDPFPKSVTDDGLDAGALLWEPAARVGDLEWPIRQRDPNRQRSSNYDSDDGGYMSSGMY